MIIDFHAHVFPERIAAATIAALSKSGSIPPFSDGTLEGLLRDMREGGVDVAVNLPVLTRPEQFDSITSFAKRINAMDSEGARVISFAGIHPSDPDPEEHIERIKNEGFLGIKIHPDYQSTFIDDESYVRILSLAKRHGLITVTHAGLDSAYVGQPIKCTPVRVLRLLDRLGGYDRLVLAHMGGRELFDEVYDSIAGEKVYLDTAFVLHEIEPTVFYKILERHSDSRLLFASDSPWRKTGEEVKLLRSLGLGQTTEEKILSGNAKALLGID